MEYKVEVEYYGGRYPEEHISKTFLTRKEADAYCEQAAKDDAVTAIWLFRTKVIAKIK